MMASLHPSRVFIIPLLLLTFTLLYFSYTYSFSASLLCNSITKSPSSHLYNTDTQSRPKPTVSAEAAFITAALEEELFNPHPIRLVCAEKKWTPGLIFLCNNPVGGLGNLRVSILTCVRFAIEAGASLIMPHIIVRNPDDIYEIRTGIRKPLSHMFDEATFVDSMRQSCPELRMYETLEDVPHYEKSYPPIELLPEDLPTPSEQIPETGMEHPEGWRDLFDAWLGKYVDYTAQTPVIIDLQRSYLKFPVYYDGAEFVQSFGRLLQFRRDARQVAGTVLYAMKELHNLSIDDPTQGIYQDSFLGAHLRTEIDAAQAWPGWGYNDLPTQAAFHLGHAAKFYPSLIYVASGDEDQVEKFGEMARDRLNATTTTKFRILREYQFRKNANFTGTANCTASNCEPSALETLESMTWDQQAQVDFLVMLRSSQFVGVSYSSFSWAVALRRRRFSRMKDGYLDGPYALSDDLSQVAGKPREWPQYAACMWP